MQRRTPWWFDVIFLTMVGVSLYLAAINRTQIGDWWYFSSYSPTAEIAKLADDAGLSADGRRLFYRTDPQMVTKEVLEASCEAENLGCITEDGRIYILRTGREEDYDEMVATAAHEMLHMAYRRVAGEARTALNQNLRSEIDRLNDATLNTELADTLDETELLDEAHSILGSEYPNLLPDTEAHYGRYFSDRSQAVGAALRSR